MYTGDIKVFLAKVFKVNHLTGPASHTSARDLVIPSLAAAPSTSSLASVIHLNERIRKIFVDGLTNWRLFSSLEDLYHHLKGTGPESDPASDCEDEEQ